MKPAAWLRLTRSTTSCWVPIVSSAAVILRLLDTLHQSSKKSSFRQFGSTRLFNLQPKGEKTLMSLIHVVVVTLELVKLPLQLQLVRPGQSPTRGQCHERLDYLNRTVQVIKMNQKSVGQPL